MDDWSNSGEALRILATSSESGQVTPAADQVAAEHEAAEWASWWKVGAAYDNPWDDMGMAEQTKVDLSKVPRLQVHEIRSAAKSFPSGAGVGVDNVAHRAIERLSDNAIGALIDIFDEC